MLWKPVFLFALLFLISFPLLPACGGGESLPPLDVDLSESGSHQTGTVNLTLYDTSRSTPVNGTYPGDVSRTIRVEIRYPATVNADNAPLDPAGAPYPLIVLSHGFMAQGRMYSFFTRHLASHGYVTAAPDFPQTGIASPGGPNAADVVNQPGDVSFVIDRMLALSGAPGQPFSGGVDPGRIGVTGHSLGSFTTLLVTYSPGYLDQRIRAALPMAAMGCAFGPDFFRNRPVPLMLAGGTADIFVTFPDNLAAAYGRAAAPKYLLEITDGTHMGFTDFDLPEHLVFGTMFDTMEFTEEMGQAMTDLLNSVGSAENCASHGPMGDPGSIEPPERVIEPSLQRRLVRIYGTAFFEIYLKEKRDYRYFFTRDFTRTTPEAVIRKDD